jgi:hypothetical protein
MGSTNVKHCICSFTMIAVSALSAIEQESDNFSVPSREAALSRLNAVSRRARHEATQYLTRWADQDALSAKKVFLRNLDQHPEPEVRERCRWLLKCMAVKDYATFGEGYLGVSMGEEWQGMIPGDDKKRFGMVVTAISEGSPAAQAKLQVGDVIVALGEHAWRESQVILDEKKGLSAQIRAIGAGKKAQFGIWRKSELLICEVLLTRRPKSLDQWRPQIQPNGMMKLDQGELQKLIDEEKNSAAYFEEWLQKAKKDALAD